MTDKSKVFDVFAYYLSEYDLLAVKALGYANRTAARKAISLVYGKTNNYLGRLIDEYDVVTSSNRKGQRNREPRNRVIETANILKGQPFDFLTKLVIQMLENPSDFEDSITISEQNEKYEPLSELQIEQCVNSKDAGASIRIRLSEQKVRVYKKSIIDNLKKLYEHTCQICNSNAGAEFGVDISEAHHIEYFAESKNNNPSNIIILCPSCHRLLHATNAYFDREKMLFTTESSKNINVCRNYHL